MAQHELIAWEIHEYPLLIINHVLLFLLFHLSVYF